MRKLIVFLLATLAILTACSQQSNNSSSSQGGAGKGDIVTKSYKTEKQLEHGKETRILTVSYSGQKYDKVILNFAGGILADEDGRVLLQLRGDKKTWAIPGGAMELGETSMQAAVREFYEETGIAVEAKRLLNVYTNFDESYPNGDKVQTVVFLYELQALENVDISNFHNEETLRLGFFSKEEIAELENVSDKHRLMLDEYFSDSFAMGL